MSISPFVQSKPIQFTSTVVVEPIYNVLTAMSLLTKPNLNQEREPWLAQTASKLTIAQRESNRLIFEWLGAALVPTAKHNSFENLLTSIEAAAPTELRNLVLKAWLKDGVSADETPERLLKDKDHFLNFVGHHAAISSLNQKMRLALYHLLNEPSVMQSQIVTHLRALWESEFAKEWEKKRSTMHYCVEELNARIWPTQSPNALLQAFIRGAIPDYITAQLSGIQQIIIVPSPYIRLHASRLDSLNTLWVFMLADFWQLPMRTEPIKRGEVKGPANALADDTRLRILELLAAHEELRAQEIIAQLDTTQSTVSRHLKQLSSAQFISEKRAGDANKIYRLNPARVSEFAYTLSALLSAENAKMVLNDVRLEQPTELRPYLDRNGLVSQWPAKWTAKKIVLDYLITKFSEGTQYKETEVNEILNQWHTYDDPVYLRRALVDSGLLGRTSDGRQYWRVAS
ncbi:MAG: metalloregulator ArsR/SmtB family transcription factor [Chloroflexota bacterium]